MPSLLHLAGVAICMLGVIGLVAVAALLLHHGGPAALLDKYLFPDANQINLKGKANSSSSKTASNVFRILSFGDSLTEGFTSGGQAFHPYAKALGDLLYPQLPKGIYLEIEEQGESGERVLFGMKDRLQRTLDEHQAAGRLYDWVLLLGGINDLAGDSSTASEVLAGLDVLVQSCLAHGASVLLMTLLEVASPEAAVEAQRTTLNAAIRDYVAGRKWDKQSSAASAASSNSSSSGGGLSAAGAQPTAAAAAAAAAAGSGLSKAGGRLRQGPPRVVVFDLAQVLPFEGMDPEQMLEIWDDGVHLTMHGYDYMGQLVLGALLPLVKQDLLAAGASSGQGAAAAAVAADAATGSSGRHKAD